jgi:glyoxylase-like metal-dependent hydrolase (beta-lactamase superfamily II)
MTPSAEKKRNGNTRETHRVPMRETIEQMSRLREVTSGLLVANSRDGALNTVVVIGQAGGVLLVDPARLPDELDDLGDELRARSLTPVAGFSTHAHSDHLLWHPDFGDVPRWASPDTLRLAGSHRGDILASLGSDYRPDVLALVGHVSALPGLDVPWPGPETDVLLHDAQIEGHSALWIGELGVLIAGDMLSDIELPLLDDSPAALATYRAGIEVLAPYAGIARFVVPGHGSITSDGRARVDADHRYLDDLAAGRACRDPRIVNPGMLEAHAINATLI